MNELSPFCSLPFWPSVHCSDASASPHAPLEDEPRWNQALMVARSVAHTAQEALPRLMEVANDNAKIARQAIPSVLESMKYGVEVAAETTVEAGKDLARAAPEATLAAAIAGPTIGALVLLGEIAFRDHSLFRSHAGRADERTVTTYTPLGRDPADSKYVPFSNGEPFTAPLEFDPKQLDAARRHNVAVVDPRLKTPDAQLPGILDTQRVRSSPRAHRRRTTSAARRMRSPPTTCPANHDARNFPRNWRATCGA